MKVGAVIIGLTLSATVAACSDVPNTFNVKSNRMVTSADLRLCGKEKRLHKLGDSFVGAQRITCEGEGQIIVRSDRAPVTCVVGYVTPGAVQDFSFLVEAGSCRPV